MKSLEASHPVQIKENTVISCKNAFRIARGHVMENAVPYILGGATLGLLAIVNAPHIHGVDFWTTAASAFDHILAGAVGIPTWEPSQEQGLVEAILDPSHEGLRHVAAMAAIDTGMGFAVGVVEKALKRILPDEKMENRLKGVEPLNKKDVPKHVFIGPSVISSDMARRLYEDTPKEKNRSVVVVHTDEPIPPRFEQEVNAHFKIETSKDLLGTFSRGKEQFIEVTGIERADEITFICVNPENAVGYGSTGEMQITPDFVSSLLNKIPPEKLKGKKINVIAPQIAEIGGLSTIEQELIALSKKLGFTLIYKTPEEMLLTEGTKDAPSLKDRLLSIAENTDDTEFRIVLAGQANEANDKDGLMLKALAKAISQLSIGKKINVEIIRRLDSEQEPVNPDILKNAHYILCYGNTDQGTTSLIRMLLSDENLKIDSNKIGAIIEKINLMFDVDLAPENVFLIYDMMLKAFSATTQRDN